ncbi:MAG: outer membrane protein transport protein [Ignavibacterium sp.]|jgi:long-subunit fatty acid transport protein|nr:outer membrane protein transport protein [Ignavibacterium sp.]
MKMHILKLFCAIILGSSLINAQNYNDAVRLGFPGLGSNARALGMGNAFNALSDDASAAFFNPAGFGLLKRMEFSGGLSFINYDNKTTLFANQTQDNTTNTSLNRISFALPFPTYRGSLVFGLSYHNLKDFTSVVKFDGFNSGINSKIQSLLNTDIPFDLYLTDVNNNTIINGNLNQSGDILNSGGIDNWTLSGAIEVQKNFFIGGNLTIINGSFESVNDYYEDDTKNIYQGETAPGEPQTTDFKTFYFNNTLKWDIGGWNAKVGFLYQFEDLARFGATVQFPKTFTVDEEFIVNGSSEFGNGQIYYLDSDYYSDKVAYNIKTPFEITGAFAVNLKGIILSAEATLIDYSQLKFSKPEGLTSSYISEVNKEIKDVLTAALNYNFGAEYTVPSIGLRIRGGFINQSSPFKDDASDFNHKYITGGLGFLADGTLGIDIAYAYGWWKDISDNYNSNVSRIFQDVKVHNVMLTTTYRF